ncbi:MAG TPA: site-2 protease family protein [Phycisphaerae bacterium]|nr:site-2 protease family protein [Phycisphaerae bacterium]HNU47045.1 site-2 protease family protein [Phycisphaerae bacterium]
MGVPFREPVTVGPWRDGTGQEWLVTLEPQRIIFETAEECIELGREAWQRDLQVAPHAGGYIVRYDTFERTIGFALTRDEVAPLLRLLGGDNRPTLGAVGGGGAASGEPAPAPLLWPKVSRLAVWALICSALVFLPVLGVIPALVTVVLLIVHRVRVRRTRAYGHSRKLCLAALVLLVVGAVVSGLGTVAIVRTMADEPGQPGVDLRVGRGGAVRKPTGPSRALASAAGPFMTAASDTFHVGGAGPALLRQRAAAQSRAAGGDDRPVADGRGSERQREIALGLSEKAADTMARWSGGGVPVALAPARARESGPVLLAARSGAGVRAATTPSVVGQATGEGRNWGLVAAGLLVVLLSLTVHECAHGISAWWLGDDFARRLGRVTLNPLAHIDLFGTVVLPLILFMANAGVFGWAKPVPVRLDYVDRPRRAHILISLAGPGSNLLLAAVAFMLLLGLGAAVTLFAPGAQVRHFDLLDFGATVSATGFPLAELFGPVCTVLRLTFLINVFLAFFNLIPVPPLDGSWVLEHFFPRTIGRVVARIRPFGFVIFLVLLWTKVLSYLMMPVLLVLLPAYVLLEMATPFAG